MHCTNCATSISDLAEVCPGCGVRQFKVKNFCHNCGDKVKSIQEICTSCGITLKQTPSTSSSEAMHPAVPTLLTFLIMGLGQIVNGQVFKGVVFLVGSIFLALITFGLSLVITYPVAAIDAFLIAKKRKEGKQVGDWEFF